MTNDEAVPRRHRNEPEQPAADEAIDNAIERIRTALQDYPWRIDRS